MGDVNADKLMGRSGAVETDDGGHMHKLVNHLVQLQELTQIRDEQKVSGEVEHLEQLNESIDAMKVQLPKEIRRQLELLDRKDRMVIVPVADENCTGCGMRLPVSLVQRVRQGKGLISCPNCARILYWMAAAPRRMVKRARRSAPRKAGIARFSAASLMVPNLQADDMEACITALAARMEQEQFVDDAGKLVDIALRREAMLSTVVDHGLAFPHVRGVEGGGLTFALGTNPKGLELGGDSGNRTRIVFFVVIPTAASAFYLKLLAGLTETFRKPDARKALLAEKEPEKIWKTLIKVTRATIK